MLLTSRRDEHTWLGDLPARVQLPPMPMRESLQLAAALAARHGHSLAGADWRPLLRYAAGNPLTITVLVGQALRENLATTEDIEGFVARLRAGEAQLEAGEDAALGRTRSLAASLSYGFAQAFTDAERARLAVLHLFRDTADVDALRYMGDPEALGEDAVPELAGLDRDAGDRAAGPGGRHRPADLARRRVLPDPPRPALVLHHPVHHQPTASPAAPPPQRATRAYTKAIGALGDYYIDQAEEGRAAQVVPVLRAEEANLRHALDLARAGGLWDAAVGCLQGLRVLYRADRAGQRMGPAGRRHHPGLHRPRHRRAAARPRRPVEHHHRLPGAARAGRRGTGPPPPPSKTPAIAWDRDQAAAALAAPAASLTPRQRNQIRNLAVCPQRTRQHPPRAR